MVRFFGCGVDIKTSDYQGDIRKCYRYWSRTLKASYYRSTKS